jgi:hypothetical protein
VRRNRETRVERRGGGYIVALDGRPPGWKADEYRTADRAQPPASRCRSAEHYRQRLAALEVRLRATDLLEVRA